MLETLCVELAPTTPHSTREERVLELSPSILGQPPTEVEEDANPHLVMCMPKHVGLDGVDNAIRTLTSGVSGMKAEDWIMNEKLEEGSCILPLLTGGPLLLFISSL